MISGRVPRALAVVVLGAGAVTALVLGRATDSVGTAAEPRPSDATSHPAVTASSSPDQPPTAAIAAPDQEASERSDPEVATAAAIAAWQQQDTTARTDGLATVATPAYQQAAAEIEPSRVPTSPLTTTSLRVEADGQALVDARLEDGTALVALLVQVDDTWLLDDLQPVDDLDAAGAP